MYDVPLAKPFSVRELEISIGLLGDGNASVEDFDIVTQSIFQKWNRQGKSSFTEEEIFAEVNQAIRVHTIISLEKKGLVETLIGDDGEFYPALTELGQANINKENEENEENNEDKQSI